MGSAEPWNTPTYSPRKGRIHRLSKIRNVGLLLRQGREVRYAPGEATPCTMWPEAFSSANTANKKREAKPVHPRMGQQL